MERLSIVPGRVVYSTQGRDEGRYFVVTEVVDDRHVMMSDGLTRKLTHPKKKKLMHLKVKPLCMDQLTELRANNTLQDASIRNFLRENGLGLEQPLCKEDE